MDCDMFMWYLGGGIGHKATDFFEQHTVKDTPEFGLDLEEKPIITDEIPDVIRPNNGDADDEEVDKVDKEEETDFGYGDDVWSKDEGSDQAKDDGDEEDEEDEDHGFDDL